MTIPDREPHITMVESAVRFQLGYGYGFDKDLETQITWACRNSNSVAGAAPPGIGDACSIAPPAGLKPGFLSPETYLFARSEYQYFRFGLGFTLMNDGYYTHELGDSWHGMDWDFDELHFNLGLATTNASVVPARNSPMLPAIPLGADKWHLFVDVRTAPPGNGTLSVDAAEKPTAGSPPSQRVDVIRTAPNEDGLDLQQNDLMVQAGGYELSVWAKASKDKTAVFLNTRKGSAPWSSYGLNQQLVLTGSWAQYNFSFTCPVNSSEGRLSFYFGKVASGSTVWINSPMLTGAMTPPPVLRREFECGVTILNGDTLPHTIAVGPGLKRLKGQQAPLHQYFIDDNSSAFKSVGNWKWGNYNSGYLGGGSEEVRPVDGYYHHWEQGAHSAAAGSSASFDLQIPSAGKYDLKMWWPAAVPERSGWSSAMTVTVSTGSTAVIIAPVTLDLTKQGGDVWFPIVKSAQLVRGASLTMSCPHGVGTCIADAVLVESEARYNDGSDAASVTLGTMDAIVLSRTNPPAHCSRLKSDDQS